MNLHHQRRLTILLVRLLVHLLGHVQLDRVKVLLEEPREPLYARHRVGHVCVRMCVLWRVGVAVGIRRHWQGGEAQ